jgi:thiamine transport system ATP-binding protein
VLDVREVTVSFDGTTVLDSVSLHVAQGEIVALLGASGSGKSTLLRVIAGLVPTQSGCVVLDGFDVTRVPTHRRHVGMVFQDEQLFPHLSVADNIAFGLKMAGVGKVERRARTEDLLAVVGLPGFGQRSVDTLSGGEIKRVAVARSLAAEPKVLLLDEPLTGLDRDLHDRLQVEVADIIRATGTTAIWVTHDEAEAIAVSDRIALLASGRIASSGA